MKNIHLQKMVSCALVYAVVTFVGCGEEPSKSQSGDLKKVDNIDSRQSRNVNDFFNAALLSFGDFKTAIVGTGEFKVAYTGSFKLKKKSRILLTAKTDFVPSENQPDESSSHLALMLGIRNKDSQQAGEFSNASIVVLPPRFGDAKVLLQHFEDLEEGTYFFGLDSYKVISSGTETDFPTAIHFTVNIDLFANNADSPGSLVQISNGVGQINLSFIRGTEGNVMLPIAEGGGPLEFFRIIESTIRPRLLRIVKSGQGITDLVRIFESDSIIEGSAGAWGF